MHKKVLVKIAIETFPILFGAVVTYFLWGNNFLLALIFLAATAVILKLKYYPGDLFAFSYGALLGFGIEVFQTSIAKFHTFSNPDILGIPIWMPLVWGYGFMLMKRIGILIYEDARSAKKKAM